MAVVPRVRFAALAGVVAVLPLAACGSDDQNNSAGDMVSRAATGDIAVHGGARRLDGDRSTALRGNISEGKARNVILLIGDGMGDSEMTVARNYAHGAGGAFVGLDALELTGEYTTYSLNKDGTPDYVTDSAASATGWATGTKTYNGALAITIKDEPQQTILELAKAQGFATGNVSTAEIQDATPAALVSHVTYRKCYGPVETAKTCPTDALESGGAGSITEQLLDARPDVTLGGGAETFRQTAAAGDYRGKTLEVQAKERGYQIARTADELASITTADQDAPVIGLFAEGNMPVRWAGPTAERQGYLQPAVRCTDNPQRGAQVPTLDVMTKKAIDLLSASKAGTEKGFFLQVEGASIDKQDHLANACAQIGETVDFDAAVEKALDFARKDANTLVIVTADHGHTSQIVPVLSETKLQAIADENELPVERVRDIMYPGLTNKLKTADNAEMVVSYGTSADVGIEDETHTGTQVTLAAYGPQAGNVAGLTDQTDLFFTMTNALGIDTSAK